MSKNKNQNRKIGNTENKENKLQTNEKKSKILNLIVLVGLAIIIFYVPYFRGLYFNEEMSTTFLFTGIVFLVYLANKLIIKNNKIIKSYLDIAVAALVLAYLLPILFGMAASAQYAWDKLLRYVDYFFIYLIARDLLAKRKNLIIILNTIIISAIGVCILGIDAGAGSKLTNGINALWQWKIQFLHLSGGVANLMSFKFMEGFTEGRIYSTLQYPNVLASFLGAVFILITGLLMTEEKGLKRFLYGAAGFIVLYTLILTGSRGMFLIFPIAFLLFLIVLRKKQFVIDAIVTAAMPALIGLLLATLYNNLIDTSRYSIVWLSVLAGALLSGVCLYFIDRIRNPLHNSNTKLILSIPAVVLLIAIGIAGFGLTMEKPLVISHSLKESNAAKSVIRDISGVKPNTKYSLEFDIKSDSQKPSAAIYEVNVFSITQFAELEVLAKIKGGAESTRKKLEFTTKPTTKNIRIQMTNFELGSSAAFSRLMLKDLSNGGEKRIIAQYAYLPTDLVYKVKDISFTTHNVWQRFTFVQDAFKIIKEYPLIGAGGGGWRALYHKYQSYDYASNEVHNHPVQLWVETGIFGFGVLLLIGGLLIYQFYKIKVKLKEDLEEKSTFDNILTCAIFVSIVSLYVHSVIDFDFSLSAVSIFVWALTGLLAGYFITIVKPKDVGDPSIDTIAISLAVVMGITLTVAGFNSISGRLIIAESQKYAGKMTQKQFKEAAPNILSIYDRYLGAQPLDEQRRSDYVNTLVQAYKLMPKETKNDFLSTAEKNVDINIGNEPYSFQSLIQAGSFDVSKGDYQKGLGYMDTAVEYWKFIDRAYTYKAEVYLMAGQSAISQGKTDIGKSYLEKVISIPKEVEAVNKTALKPMAKPQGLDEPVKMAESLLGKK
jgi:hypothetical protein